MTGKSRIHAPTSWTKKETSLITNAGRNIPKSPFHGQIEGFAGDANKVTAAGPGIEPERVVANNPTNFDIFTEGAGKENLK